jgi:Phage integrase, N-terminal SAM-like domain
MEKSLKELLKRVRKTIRLQNYCYQTEKSYIGLIRRYICFHNQRHPEDMASVQIRAFLRHRFSCKKTLLHQLKIGVADCGMKTIVLCGENPFRDVKFYVSTSKIHTSIQQSLKIKH